MSKFLFTAAVHAVIGSWLVLVVGGCNQPDAASKATPQVNRETRRLVLHGAASTQDALNEVLPLYQADQQTIVTTNYGSSATLAQQILQDAPADLFLSASLEWVDKLEAENLVAKRQNLLSNRLVVIVPSDSTLKITNLEDLRSAAIEHLAMADFDSVPAGKYAKQALEKTGVWSDVAERIVRGGDVRQALTFVELGEADSGIVYATDAAGSTSVRVVYEVPAELSEPIVYPLAMFKSDSDTTPAEVLFEFLCSPAAAAVFKKHGFEVLPAQANESE